MAPSVITFEEAKEIIGTLPSLAPRPNASNIRSLSEHLEQRLQTIPSQQSPDFGYLGLVQPAAIYALRTNEPWNNWPDPGPHPQAANTTAQQNNLRTLYEANKAVYDSQQNVRRAVNEALNVAVPNAFRKPAGNQIGTKTANNQRFDQPWDPNEPIEALFDRLEECYIFAIMAKPPFTLEQVIDKAIIAIQRTGLYETALLEWQGFDEANITWEQLKHHFEEAYEIRLASGQGTAATHGYVYKAEAQDDNSISTIHESLQSIHIANNANFQSIQEHIQAARTETATLRAELQAAQQTLANLAHTTPPTMPPSTYIPSVPPATIIQRVPPAAYNNLPSYASAPMQYPPQQQLPGYIQQNYNRGHGRRTNNRRGNRRGNTQQYTQPFGAMIPPVPTVGGYITPPSMPTAGAIKKTPYSNTTKFFNNWNMCYSCGWDVPQWHNSHTCADHVPGHQEGCTRANAQAYMTAGHQEEEDDDEQTIVTSNKAPLHQCDGATNTTAELTEDDLSSDEDSRVPTKRPTEFAIMDSGATAHFLVKGAAVKNKQPTGPLKIKLPNGTVIQSTHTCNLDIPWLPNSITEAHIVPGLSHSSLVATRKFCDAGCQIIFNADECRVSYKGNIVLSGNRDPSSGLWRVPINPTKTVNNLTKLDLSPTYSQEQYAANLYTLPFKQQQVKYVHQAFFSPPTHPLLKAINNGQLEGVPYMKSDLIRKYLAPSPATSKGRMKRPRMGIRSTRPRDTKKPEPVHPVQEPSPTTTSTVNVIPFDTIDDSVCNVFCYAALADKQAGTMYTDATGALPAISLEGHQYYFVAYAYDPNYIFAKPLSNLKDETILTAFGEVFQQLKDKGFKPDFNVTDNQAATPIKNYLRREEATWQFVEPNNHHEVYNELFESIQKLKVPAKRKFLKRIAKALDILATTPHPTSPATEGEPNSEGGTNDIVFQRENEAPKVTTSNNPTAPALIKSTQRMHQRHTRTNTPGQLPAIINPANDMPTTRRSPRLATIDESPIITTQGPSSSRITLHSPNIIACQALNHLTQQVYTDPNQLWVPNTFVSSSPPNTSESCYNVDIKHFCNGLQHPVTGETITTYKRLINIPQMREIWTTAFGKEFGNLAQGDNKTGRTVTYGRIVIDFHPQKADPNRVRITAGGNLIKDYPGELTTRTADLTTSKILWNSVLSTEGA
eukprot:CCRYP_012303-RA/>CCRYP_012303-RA protein AED:0.45 eAED:0.14 QI:0/0/0/0.6/1/1/5/0/1176